MKIKKEYIILAVVIIALVAYLASRKSDRSLYELPQPASVETKEITRIELKTSDGGTVLIKEGSDWVISPENFPADSQKVKAMLTIASDLTLTELISESKNYQRYDLGSSAGIVVKCWAKDDLKREMTIGKSAGSNNHTFVKLPGDDAVYHAKGDFRRKFDMERGAFRDKSVLTFDKNVIAEITVQAENATEIYKKEGVENKEEGVEEKGEATTTTPPSEPKWVNGGGQEADTAKVSSLLNTLAALKCEKFIEDKTKTDFTTPTYTLSLKGVKTYTLSIFPEIKNEDETYFPAISSENDFPFLLTKWGAENIMKKPADLLKQIEEKKQPAENN